MEPPSESSRPEPNASGENQGEMDIAIRAAFLEAFARELARGTAKVHPHNGEPPEIVELPENGYRPVNRLAGLC